MTGSELPTDGSPRTCGNCGATVDTTAVICPACDALLAAYEAPSGSATMSGAASLTAFETGSVTIPEPETTPPLGPEPTPFDADAAMAEARRVLGMPISHATTARPSTTPAVEPTPEPAPEVEASPEPVRPKQPREQTPAAAPAPAAVQPQQPGPRSQPQPAVRTPAREAPRPQPTATAPPVATPVNEPDRTVAPPHQASVQASLPRTPQTRDIPGAEPPSGHESHPAITVAQIVKWGLITIVVLMFLSRTPLGFSPFIVVVFAFIILSNVLKGSAKAGGRKTTTMYDPTKQDHRRH
jgi:hypothetical protein